MGPARQIVYQRVDALKPNKRNARTHSKEQVAQIVAAIGEFGWTNPILIDENGGIIAGHGRRLAAIERGDEKVPCIVVADLSDAQKRALALADNKLALNAGWDEDLLHLELGELRTLEFDIELIGFDELELKALFKADGDGEAAMGQLVNGKFSIVIECRDELMQSDLLSEFDRRGLTCRALML